MRHYALVLQDRSRGKAERAEALRFLGHFVGDLHQPLHAGRLEDRGGNSIAVHLPESADCAANELSLHSVWDTTLLCDAGLTWPESVPELNSGVSSEQEASWKDFDVLEWTNESYRLAEEFAYQLPRNGEIDAAYYDRALLLSKTQLQRAGVRLALLINAAAVGSLNFPE